MPDQDVFGLLDQAAGISAPATPAPHVASMLDQAAGIQPKAAVNHPFLPRLDAMIVDQNRAIQIASKTHGSKSPEAEMARRKMADLQSQKQALLRPNKPPTAPYVPPSPIMAPRRIHEAADPAYDTQKGGVSLTPEAMANLPAEVKAMQQREKSLTPEQRAHEQRTKHFQDERRRAEIDNEPPFLSGLIGGASQKVNEFASGVLFGDKVPWMPPHVMEMGRTILGNLLPGGLAMKAAGDQAGKILPEDIKHVVTSTVVGLTPPGLAMTGAGIAAGAVEDPLNTAVGLGGGFYDLFDPHASREARIQSGVNWAGVLFGAVHGAGVLHGKLEAHAPAVAEVAAHAETALAEAPKTPEVVRAQEQIEQVKNLKGLRGKRPSPSEPVSAAPLKETQDFVESHATHIDESPSSYSDAAKAADTTVPALAEETHAAARALAAGEATAHAGGASVNPQDGPVAPGKPAAPNIPTPSPDASQRPGEELKQTVGRAFMSGANQESNAFRRDIQLPPLSEAERVKYQKTFEEAVDRGLHRDTDRILGDVEAGKPISEHDQAGVIVRLHEIKQQILAAESRASKAVDANDTQSHAAARKDAEALQPLYDRLSEANRQIGTGTARTLGIRGVGLDEDLTVSQLTRRFKSENGKAPDASTLKKFIEIERDNTKLRQTIAEMEADHAKALDEAKAGATAITARGSNPRAARSEAESAWKKLEKELAGVSGKQAGAIHVPESPYARLAQVVAAEVKGGASLDQAIATVVKQAKDRFGLDIDPKSLTAEFGGYSRLFRERTTTLTAQKKQLALAKREAYLLAKIDDVKSGTFTPGAAIPRTSANPRLAALTKELSALRDEMKLPAAEREARSLEHVRGRIAELESQVRTGAVKPPTPKTRAQVSDDLIQLRAKQRQLQNKARTILSQAKKTKVERLGEQAAGLSTELKLMNPFARIIDVASNAQTLADSALFGGVDRAVQNRIIRGENVTARMSPEMKAEIRARLKPESMRDWTEHGGEYALKMGFEGPFGKLAARLDEPFRVRHQLNWVGERAQAIAKQRNLSPDQYGELIDQIRDPNLPGPLKQGEAMRIHNESQMYADRMVYTNANIVSKATSWATGEIQRSAMPPSAKAASTYALRTIAQFSKVLANVTDATGQYGNPVYAAIRYWMVKGSIGKGKPHLASTIPDALLARQAAQIARRGGLGTGIAVLGYLAYDKEKDKAMMDASPDARWLMPEIVEGMRKGPGVHMVGTGKASYQSQGMMAQVGGAMSAFLMGWRLHQILDRVPPGNDREKLLIRLMAAPLTDNPIVGNADTLQGVLSGDSTSMDKARGAAIAMYFPGGLSAWTRLQQQEAGVYGVKKEGIGDEYRARVPGASDVLNPKGDRYEPHKKGTRKKKSGATSVGIPNPAAELRRSLKVKF